MNIVHVSDTRAACGVAAAVAGAKCIKNAIDARGSAVIIVAARDRLGGGDCISLGRVRGTGGDASGVFLPLSS
jgi:hypothetical protein